MRELRAEIRPRTVVTVPGEGKYVWHPALYTIDFIPHGKRNGEQIAFAYVNSHHSVLRAVGRDINQRFKTRT